MSSGSASGRRRGAGRHCLAALPCALLLGCVLRSGTPTTGDRRSDSTPGPPAGPGEPAPASARATVTSSDPVAVAREQLQGLRPEAADLLAKLPPEADADGLPLLRRQGALYYWPVGETLPESNVEWILDPWGNPIVIVRAESNPDDWCLVSPGPDGLWTTGSLRGVARAPRGKVSHEDLIDSVPHYHGDQETVHRSVLGDDVVVGSSGLFFKAYTAPLPSTQESVRALVALLRGEKATGLAFDPGCLEEIEDLTAAERDLLGSFLGAHEHQFLWSEDTWSHECSRGDGFLPVLYLWSDQLSRESDPFVWIEPREDGWTLDWDLELALKELEEGTEDGEERK